MREQNQKAFQLSSLDVEFIDNYLEQYYNSIQDNPDDTSPGEGESMTEDDLRADEVLDGEIDPEDGQMHGEYLEESYKQELDPSYQGGMPSNLIYLQEMNNSSEFQDEVIQESDEFGYESSGMKPPVKSQMFN